MIHKIAPLVNKRLIAAILVALPLLAVGLAWRTLGTSTEEAGADPRVTEIRSDIYRSGLPADTHPSVWVPKFPTVAIVTVEDVGHSAWNTESGTYEGLESFGQGAMMYTPVTVSVDEYIKGSGDDRIVVELEGGFVDGIRMEIGEPLQKGDQAVVFLRDRSAIGEPDIVDNAYVFHGDTASSNIDEKTIAVDDLLTGVRDAAPPKTSE